MALRELSIPIDHVMRVTMTVRLTGYRKWHLRAQLAVWLIRLAARLLNWSIEVKERYDS